MCPMASFTTLLAHRGGGSGHVETLSSPQSDLQWESQGLALCRPCPFLMASPSGEEPSHAPSPPLSCFPGLPLSLANSCTSHRMQGMGHFLWEAPLSPRLHPSSCLCICISLPSPGHSVASAASGCLVPSTCVAYNKHRHLVTASQMDERVGLRATG